MSAAFLGLPYLLWAGGCVVVALLFALIWPFKPGLDGMTAIALRWLHPLVWLVLAVSFLVRGAGTQGAANVLALLGGITYACFLGTVVVATSKPTRRR